MSMYFQFFWIDGTTSVASGENPPDALKNLGYDNAPATLDFCRPVKTPEADITPYAYNNGRWTNMEAEALFYQGPVD